MPRGCTSTFGPPATLTNTTAATIAFWGLLMQPNASSSREFWRGHDDALSAPLTRTRRFFCCGTAQRAWFSCRCLRLPKHAKESWPICLDHRLGAAGASTTAATVAAVPAAAAAVAAEGGPSTVEHAASPTCLVYSFGIADQWEFDDTMADRGCEVHSFDPTGSTMAVHARHRHPSGRVHFHPWGLSSSAACAGASQSRAPVSEDGTTRRRDSSAGVEPLAGAVEQSRRYSGGTYGNLTGPLLSLDQIVRRLGHAGRTIDVLKVDCEVRACTPRCRLQSARRIAPRCSSVSPLYRPP